MKKSKEKWWKMGEIAHGFGESVRGVLGFPLESENVSDQRLVQLSIGVPI